MCFNLCLSVAVLNARQRFGQILPRGATHTKYGREGGSGKCALQSFDKCCNVATGRIRMFLSVLPSICYTFLTAHFSIFPSSHLAEVPYILESNPHPNLIRTSFCRFLKRKNSKFAVLIRTFPSTAPCVQLLQKSRGGCRLHGKPSLRALSSDLSRSVA